MKKEDSELEMNDTWSEDSSYKPKIRRFESGHRKILHILLVLVLVFVFAVGIVYFIGQLRGGGEAGLLESKMAVIEQRIEGLERQLTEIQGKMNAPGADLALIQKMDEIAQKVEALEKQKPPAVEPKAKPSLPPSPAVSAEKKYHTVQKGETLYRISRKYRISVEELRRLNNLSEDRPLRAGQKLVVSPAR